MDECKIPFTRCAPDVPGHPNAPHPGAPHGHCCPEPPDPWAPVPPPIKPVMPIPGPNVQAQMCHVVDKVNECIDRWNYISSNCYEALNKCVGAAVNNDVYYDRDEIKLESGYDTNDECTYHVINVKCVDKANKPIRVKLGLAYDNTTDSDLRQSMQDVSFIKNANVILTAVDPAQTGWQGRTMYMGAPIAFTEKADSYVGGFNDHGVLKIFASDVDDLTLRQNCIMDCIGGVIPIIIDGEITEQAKALTKKASISAIGYKSSNGDKVFFQCSMEKSKGMQGITVASLLKNMGCTTAMITCVGVNNDSPSYSNGMMYMGASTDVPNGWLMPQNVAYWYISKRPFDGWRNKFTSEIADLVQRVGGSWNEIEFNKHRIEIVNELAEDNRDRLNVVDDRLAEIDAELDDHEQRITKLETDLAQEIKERKEEITRVDGRIDQEITDRTAADDALSKRIDQEVTDRTNADTVLQKNIDDEAKARADADLAEETERKHQDSLLEAEIDQERKDRAHADADLAEKLQTETTNRTTADAELLAKINAETTARSDADTKLTNDLAAEATARKDADVELTNEISGEATARKDADSALRNQIDAEEATRSDEDTKLRNMINSESNTRAAEDDVINARIDGIVNGSTDLGYVKRSGDTMTGSLIFQGNNSSNPLIKGAQSFTFVQGEFLEADPVDDGHTPAIDAMKTNKSTGVPYYINVRGADGVVDDDFVTKRQLNKVKGIKLFEYVVGYPYEAPSAVPCLTTDDYSAMKEAIKQGIPVRLVNSLTDAKTVIEYSGRYYIGGGDDLGYIFTATLQCGLLDRSTARLCLVTNDSFISDDLVPLYMLGEAFLDEDTGAINTSGYYKINVILGSSAAYNSAYFSWSTEACYYPESSISAEMLASLFNCAGSNWLTVQVGDDASATPCFGLSATGRTLICYYLEDGKIKTLNVPDVYFTNTKSA